MSSVNNVVLQSTLKIIIIIIIIIILIVSYTIACNFTVSLCKSKMLYAMLLMWTAILQQFISGEW